MVRVAAVSDIRPDWARTRAGSISEAAVAAEAARKPRREKGDMRILLYRVVNWTSGPRRMPQPQAQITAIFGGGPGGGMASEAARMSTLASTSEDRATVSATRSGAGKVAAANRQCC